LDHSLLKAGKDYISNASSEFPLFQALHSHELTLYSHDRNLAPGGWIEQIEFDVRVKSDDGSLPADSVLAGWGDNFIGCGERAGRSLTTQETMRASIEAAGFVDVHERLYKVPMGPWAKDRLLKEVGLLNLQHWKSGLEGYAMWLLTKFGAPTPWTKEEVEIYLVNVRKELKDSRIHAYGYA
jgi:hypothetical protein